MSKGAYYGVCSSITQIGYFAIMFQQAAAMYGRKFQEQAVQRKKLVVINRCYAKWLFMYLNMQKHRENPYPKIHL